MGLSSDGLPAFVNARLDEDEATAKAAAEYWGRVNWTYLSPDAANRCTDHVALHNPMVVLADVAAKRKILALHSPDDEYAPACTACADERTFSEMAPWPCPTVRALASAWAWHPGWREEWGDAPTSDDA